MHSFYLDAIRNFEGFTPQASWDYAQFSNGYGTRARFQGEVIDQVEAERRFQHEVSAARSIVEKAAPNVDDGTKAALTSLTYNAGTSWIESGLGDAVRRGDIDAARDIFQKYNKAGGEVLPGLVNRRAQEAQWIGNPDAVGSGNTFAVAAASEGGGVAMPPVVVDRDQSVREVAEMIRARGAPSSVNAPGVREAAVFERGPPTERSTLSGGLSSRLASETLAALVDADLKGAAAAEVVRLAQLGRGSELARSDRDRADNETRRV
ncbi:lysozyme [uncultured Hyphomicrobium sp.]|uniref:lysozyme n=1 Tax=uncultured Hyphomicrobium sp. TaxID=194373 RepID=UPI0025E7F592|nr:lysozyme [uncultured Hyphomicrobium sp.]